MDSVLKKADTLKTKPKLYTIEFLRVFFVAFVILGHIMQRYPEIKSSVLAFFHTKYMNTWFGVEFFFILGGFFLYKRILSAPDIFTLVKKLYVRLIPALLFVFLLGCLCGINKIRQLFGLLPLTTGLSIPGEVTGWGDWYVGVYFWCSLLFIGLFHNNVKQGFLWTAVLAYFTICLKFNAPYDGWMKTYYTVIGNQFIRGIYSMGIGITAAFLSDKVNITDKKGVRFFFTVMEAYCLVFIFNCIARSSHNHLNFLEMEVCFAFFLICVAHSLGYITKFFNNFSKVEFLSRYSYPIFLGHIPFIKYLLSHDNLELADTTCGLIVAGGGYFDGNF